MVKVDEHSVKGFLLRVAKMVAPWLVAVLAFWAVSYTFYAPQFDDKSLSQGDIAQYAGMSQDIREHRSATGEDPQWTGNMFSGMPAYLIDVERPYANPAMMPSQGLTPISTTATIIRAIAQKVIFIGSPMLLMIGEAARLTYC